MKRPRIPVLASSALVASVLALMSAALASGGSFLGRFHTTSTLASTVPANGAVNPYGTVVIPQSHGKLTQGDVLVSNSNNSANLQGAGTTIVEISPETAGTFLSWHSSPLYAFANHCRPGPVTCSRIDVGSLLSAL